jgi:hypothetical protein
MSLTPLLTATPNSPVTYNPNIAETFSWVPVQGAGRDLFAKATYDVTSNALSQNGATFIAGTSLSAASSFGAQYWTRIDVIATTSSTSLTATNWGGSATTSLALPAGATYFGLFTGIQLGGGSVIAYKL